MLHNRIQSLSMVQLMKVMCESPVVFQILPFGTQRIDVWQGYAPRTTVDSAPNV